MSLVIEIYISSLSFWGNIGPEVIELSKLGESPKNSKNVKKLSQYYNGFADFSDEMYGEYIVFPIF